MDISGVLDKKKFKGPLGGKPWAFDLSLDSFYIRVLDANAAYSDYYPLPDRAPYKDRYLIIDFDRDKRVVGFTIEGLLEDFRGTSLAARISVDFGLIGLRYVAKDAIEKILEYLKDQLPALDSRGRLTGIAPAYAGG